jgi:ribokinase
VAYLAAKLGVPAAIMAHVGDDDLSKQALGALEDMNIDVSAIKKVKGATTGFSMIMVPEGGKKNIVLATNANDAWEKEDAEKVSNIITAAPEGSVLVVGYEVPPFIVAAAIEAANKKGFPVVLDPSPTDRVDKSMFKFCFCRPPTRKRKLPGAGLPVQGSDKAIFLRHNGIMVRKKAKSDGPPQRFLDRAAGAVAICSRSGGPCKG